MTIFEPFAGAEFSGGPYDLIPQVFNAAWNRAQSAALASSNNFTAALTAGGGGARMTSASVKLLKDTKAEFDPKIVEPAVFIPTNAEAASVAKMTELSDAVIDKLAGLFSGYMGEYFPNECGYLEKAQRWICDTIENGGTGIPSHVEDQIWQRDRSRVLEETNRARDDVFASFAARGFPVPPGAALHAIRLSQTEASNRIAQQSRDVAIKQAEIEIENIRFAVDKAINLYGTAVAAASDYVKALSVGPTSAMQIVPSITDSQSRLISAAGDYYRARIAVKELELKAHLPSAEFEQSARIKNGDWLMQMIRNKVDAAISAAQALSTQAAAALNGLHASTSLGASSSNSVGYSYGGDVSGEVPPKTIA